MTGLAVEVDNTHEMQVHSAFSAQRTVVPACQGSMICCGVWLCDSQVATNIIALFPVGGSLGQISGDAFLTPSMNWHCSLKPKFTHHKKKLQRFQDCFFPTITSAVLPHITKQGLTLLHPRYQISSVFPGKVWTGSVTLKAFSSKCHFIGGEAITGKQSTFLEVTE